MSIAQLLSAHGLQPKKRFGQNFLTDPRIARKIAEAATSPPGGVTVEIGAGLGALTRPLLERAGRVIAIERDRDLLPILRAELAAAIASGQLEVIEADAAEADWFALLASGPRPHTLAGNLPYLITGRLLQRATALADDIDGAVFMVQAEVADRLLAPPGGKAYGALSVFVQAAFDVRRILSVKAGAFYPKPDVDSAVVHLIPGRPRRAEETPAFQQAVKAAFATRRKTLRNAWRGLYGWSRDELAAHAEEAGVDLDARGETLGVEDFDRIARAANRERGAGNAQ